MYFFLLNYTWETSSYKDIYGLNFQYCDMFFERKLVLNRLFKLVVVELFVKEFVRGHYTYLGSIREVSCWFFSIETYVLERATSFNWKQ